ncbi:Protein NrdI [Corynebacterium deserti GIMN1.010]|uniref:Protein NrdI n=1 Tax=Corynebacterium deserti GIMN1.010 TaxID=931089 RepID=A0A0M4CZH8_9CORY|nr:class Ib ribonucleoside-diphosphate reductase assembly flavoprotein NrdI [Corynebacterium deserti]ALC06657.1 Protein NrdI [Corynebacterium deserti GIMN1.010]
MLIVYFSSATNNTHRFVQKLDFPNVRIPLTKAEEPLEINEPYVLVTPTYGGGVSITGENSRPVPPQVIRFLNDEHNRSFIRAVVAGGNSNFGSDFGLAGDIISKKCKVPYVYRFELMGNEEDVEILRGGLLHNAQTLGLEPHEPVATL